MRFCDALQQCHDLISLITRYFELAAIIPSPRIFHLITCIFSNACLNSFIQLMHMQIYAWFAKMMPHDTAFGVNAPLDSSYSMCSTKCDREVCRWMYNTCSSLANLHPTICFSTVHTQTQWERSESADVCTTAVMCDLIKNVQCSMSVWYQQNSIYTVADVLPVSAPGTVSERSRNGQQINCRAWQNWQRLRKFR